MEQKQVQKLLLKEETTEMYPRRTLWTKNVLDDDLRGLLCAYWGRYANEHLARVDDALHGIPLATLQSDWVPKPDAAYYYSIGVMRFDKACPTIFEIFPRNALAAGRCLLQSLAKVFEADIGLRERIEVLTEEGCLSPTKGKAYLRALDREEDEESDEEEGDDEDEEDGHLDSFSIECECEHLWSTRGYQLIVNAGCQDESAHMFSLPHEVAVLQMKRWVFSSLTSKGLDDLLCGRDRVAKSCPNWLDDRFEDKVAYEMAWLCEHADQVYSENGIFDSEGLNFFHDEMVRKVSGKYNVDVNTWTPFGFV